jgi:hypothetical protein
MHLIKRGLINDFLVGCGQLDNDSKTKTFKNTDTEDMVDVSNSFNTLAYILLNFHFTAGFIF